MAIWDARTGQSPVPMTSFSSMKEANEYAMAYAKAMSRNLKKKQKQYFGDPEFWRNPKKEWSEDPVASNHPGDPFRPGMKEPIPNRWMGGI